VRYDIVAGTSKIAGAAQRRTRWGLLHQGSIQMPRVSLDLAKAFTAQAHKTNISQDVLQAAHQIARQKYATDEWLRKF
jgi:lipoate-protein ligase A